MARIAGINIPPHQHAEIGLTAIYGIGRARSRAILDAVKVPHSRKVKELTDAELERIREAVGRFTVEGDLRREIPAFDQAPDRPELLPRAASPPRAARSRPAHAHERPHPQGPAQGRVSLKKGS